MVVPNDRESAKRLEMLRNYGQEEKYHHQFRGFNRRLDTLHAAVLRVKLKYLEKWNAARRWQAELYHRLLAGTELVLPSEAAGAQSVCDIYLIRTQPLDPLQEHPS